MHSSLRYSGPNNSEIEDYLEKSLWKFYCLTFSLPILLFLLFIIIAVSFQLPIRFNVPQHPHFCQVYCYFTGKLGFEEALFYIFHGPLACSVIWNIIMYWKCYSLIQKSAKSEEELKFARWVTTFALTLIFCWTPGLLLSLSCLFFSNIFSFEKQWVLAIAILTGLCGFGQGFVNFIVYGICNPKIRDILIDKIRTWCHCNKETSEISVTSSEEYQMESVK